MNDVHDDTESNEAPSLAKLLLRLQVAVPAEHDELAQTAAEQHWSHLDYLQRLVEGEVNRREDSGLARRIRLARFPASKLSISCSTGAGRTTYQLAAAAELFRCSSNKNPTPSCSAMSASARPTC